MPDATSAKTCVVCGEDCAGRPRTKDPLGRYYCRGCYDAQLQKREQGHNGHQAAPPIAGAAPIDASPLAPPMEHDPFAMRLDLIDAAADGIPPAAPVAACPQCGLGLAAGAALCVNCGYDLRAGRPVATLVQHTVPRTLHPGPRSSSARSVWPIIIGVISIVFGGCGTLAYGLQFVIALLAATASQALKPALITLGATSLGMLLSLWLLTAGIGIVRRSRRGPWSIRRWAVVKIVVCVIVFSLATLAPLAILSRANAAEAPPQFTGAGAGAFVAAMLLIMGWFLLWPIFVLIWFGRSKIAAEVKQWS